MKSEQELIDEPPELLVNGKITHVFIKKDRIVVTREDVRKNYAGHPISGVVIYDERKDEIG